MDVFGRVARSYAGKVRPGDAVAVSPLFAGVSHGRVIDVVPGPRGPMVLVLVSDALAYMPLASLRPIGKRRLS
jgi:hypothetical protein